MKKQKSKFKVVLKSGIVILASVFVVFAVVKASTTKITPPTGTPVATFYSLSEIYNFITANTPATENSPALDWSAGLEDSGRTLTEIYNALSTLISADKVRSGTTYLGVAGSIADCSSEGSQTCYATGTYYAGTSKTASNSTVSQSAGYYPAFNLSTVDTDLIASNFNKNTNLFGIAGTYSGYPSTGWTSGTPITQTVCDATTGWKWFQDGNGDGDTTDAEDGLCVQTTAVTSTNNLSWNGAEQITPNNLTAKTIVSATTSSATVADGSWTNGTNYVNHIAKVATGTGSAIDCWGRVKSVNDDTDTITVYGSWLSTTYATCGTTPGANNTIAIYDDYMNDNSWIGDWSCVAGSNALNGTVSYGSYPTSAQVASGKFIALATTDCYDGVRDLLPIVDSSVNDSRIVYTGTAELGSDTTLTDSDAVFKANMWVGQKVKIFAGTSAGSWGIIESNTPTILTVTSWSAGNPDNTSQYGIIYIVPHASYTDHALIDGDANDGNAGNEGPLTQEVINNWKGTKLPTASDFFGFCGATLNDADNTAGDGNYYASGASPNISIGIYGNNVGRGRNTASSNDEYLDVSNTGAYEWLSEQISYINAQIAGTIACSYFNYTNVYYGVRFRAVLRP